MSFTLIRTENKRILIELAEGYSEPGFMHYPAHASMPPWEVIEPNKPNLETAERVIRAYQLAMREYVPPSPGMWDEIESRNPAFIRALNTGNVPCVAETLSRMFRTNLVYGLGKVHESLARDNEEGVKQVRRRWTDLLVSLAEAVGTRRVRLLLQEGIESFRRALDVDVDELLIETEQRIGFDLSFPPVGGIYGCRAGDKFVTMDSLWHASTLYRLTQLGAESSSRIAEIGGGYGCLGMMAARAGFSYEIFDLPWVGAIQGYFLIEALGGAALFGEKDGKVRVSPYWRFFDLPDASLDYIVNTNSLPEMGEETGLAYLREMGRLLNGQFLSVNQEGKARGQTCVAELAERAGTLRRLSRHLAWVEQGYVEEVYAPK
ncbi:MAG TPA: hypothetical protein VF791_00400 [Pyrinomonadaceae bacterium]